MTADPAFIGPPPPPNTGAENDPPAIPQQARPLPPSIWRVHFWKWVLLLAVFHFVLAQSYSMVMPYRTPAVSYHKFLPDVGAPDERAHAQVISDLVNTGRYPVFDASQPDFMDKRYQAHQPPLYYTLTALTVKAFGQTDVESQLFGRIARALNSLFGALNVAGCAALAWWFFAHTRLHRARLALTGATFVALIPMNLAVSGSINNDSLVFALITWSWAFAARSRYRIFFVDLVPPLRSNPRPGRSHQIQRPLSHPHLPRHHPLATAQQNSVPQMHSRPRLGRSDHKPLDFPQPVSVRRTLSHKDLPRSVSIRNPYDA